MKKTILAVCLTLQACAAAPEKIAPVANASGIACTTADRAELDRLSAEQAQLRKDDIARTVIFGVVGNALMRPKSDNADRIAVLKGRCS